MQIKTQALLTGAGFSYNVGGLSGHTFVKRLSNHPRIQENNRIATLFYAKRADYESIYRTVIEGEEFTQNDRDTILEAYDDAYSELDRAICSRCGDPQGQQLSLNALSEFLDWFAGSTKIRGHIFTLNQTCSLRGDTSVECLLAFPGFITGG